MRLWSVHPRYFDRQALTACWREGLLAQSVLDKRSGGYAHHPQLQRFRAHAHPRAALGAFLHAVVDEADARGYRFDRSKVAGDATDRSNVPARIPVTSEQLAFEWRHLQAKLAVRSPSVLERVVAVAHPEPNPVFVEVPGAIESWERVRGVPT